MHSVCPSPSGWYPKVKWSSICSSLPREWKKWETNSVPLSEVTCDGTPCLEKTWVRNSWASSGELMVSCVGMKRDCLVRQSTTTRMAVNLLEDGRCLMKSMVCQVSVVASAYHM